MSQDDESYELNFGVDDDSIGNDFYEYGENKTLVLRCFVRGSMDGFESSECCFVDVKKFLEYCAENFTDLYMECVTMDKVRDYC